MVDIEFASGSQADVFNSLFDDGQRFQSQKVHFDQSGFFDHRTFVLSNQHFLAGFFIFCRTDRYDVRNIISSDNNTTGMYTGVTHVAFQHLCIF